MGCCRALGLGFVMLLLASCANNGQTGGASMAATAPTQVLEPSATVASATTEPTLTATAESTQTTEPTVTPIAPTAEATTTAAPTNSPTPSTVPTIAAPALIEPRFVYPLSTPGGIPGDDFFMRHGFDTENIWYNPGYWHTGEDWYAIRGDTAGAEVHAIADGVVVYAGSNYPGRVVIVRHADDLYSMYGHLDPALEVVETEQVARNQLLGTVLRRDDTTPNHLHFEVRTFLLTDAVNGPSPRYDFRCGPGCAPGPGYWPIDAPELPDALGWRNPTHVIAGRSGWTASEDTPATVLGEVVVAAGAPSQTLTLWSTLDASFTPVEALGDIAVPPGERLAVLDSRNGDEAPDQTSATAYRLWYRVRLSDGREGWVEALIADTNDQGSDGAPSSVRLMLIPAIPK